MPQFEVVVEALYEEVYLVDAEDAKEAEVLVLNGWADSVERDYVSISNVASIVQVSED